MKYIAAEQVLFIHARIIDESGGAHGIRDLGLLKSAIGRPQATFDGRELYTDIFHKAAALMESLISNRPFIDGNKRTSIASAAIFMLRNGFRLRSGQHEIEHLTLDMALKKTFPDDAAAWIRQHAVRSNK